MPIPILPDAPSRTDPTNFSAKADAWVQALGPWTTAANQLEQSLQLVSTTGTSTTSKTIANGSWTLTTQTGKAWSIGAYLYFASSSDVSKVMTGQVTAYNSGTGSLTVNITVVRGSGTYADWVIGLAVPDQAALNLSGGSGGSIPYQSSANTTSMLAVGTSGQVLQCNGASAPSWVNNSGRLLNIQIFESGGTWTYSKTSGTTKILCYVVGGGGTGAGTVATGAGQSSLAGPGGSGGILCFFSTYDWDGATIIGGDLKITTGSGQNGETGNLSSITKGSYNYVANGGYGGAISAASSTFPRFETISGSAGGSSHSSAPGDIVLPSPFYGGSPADCISISSTMNFIPAGGSSPFGGAQRDRWGSTFDSGYGSGYGGGGYGSANGPSSSARFSGYGLPGIIIIYEYS